MAPKEDRAAVDWESLRRRVGTDPVFLRELLALFEEEKGKHISSIRKALADGDANLLKAAAHALKGTVGNLCAPRVFEEASRFEECSRRDGPTEARKLWPSLERSLDDLMQDLQKVLS